MWCTAHVQPTKEIGPAFTKGNPLLLFSAKATQNGTSQGNLWKKEFGFVWGFFLLKYLLRYLCIQSAAPALYPVPPTMVTSRETRTQYHNQDIDISTIYPSHCDFPSFTRLSVCGFSSIQVYHMYIHQHHRNLDTDQFCIPLLSLWKPHSPFCQPHLSLPSTQSPSMGNHW